MSATNSGSASGSTAAAGRRPGRPARPAKAKQSKSVASILVEATASSSNDTTPSEELSVDNANVSVLAISPTLEDTQSSMSPVTAVSECRRSSRKKIIKFDVRDLLNKNRKNPPKVQIEARLDSNAPHTKEATAEAVSGASMSEAASSDLESKRKVFLEKSAIFRRFSTDPMASTGATWDQGGASKAESMITDIVSSEAGDKPKKQPGRRKKTASTTETAGEPRRTSVGKIDASASGVPKRRGRPPKNRSLVESPASLSMHDADTERLNNTIVVMESVGDEREANLLLDFVPESAMAVGDDDVVQEVVVEGTLIEDDLIEEDPAEEDGLVAEEDGLVAEEDGLVAEDSGDVEGSSQEEAAKPEEFFVEECPIAEEVVEVRSGPTIEMFEAVKEYAGHTNQEASDGATKPRLQRNREHPGGDSPLNDIILEISSSSSAEASSSFRPFKGVSAGVSSFGEAAKQRSFAAVSFIQESSSAGDEFATSPEFIVAAVEEIELDQTAAGGTNAAATDMQYYVTKTEADEDAEVEQPTGGERSFEVVEAAALKESAPANHSISCSPSISLSPPSIDEPQKVGDTSGEKLVKSPPKKDVKAASDMNFSRQFEKFVEEVAEQTVEEPKDEDVVEEVAVVDQTTVETLPNDEVLTNTSKPQEDVLPVDEIAERRKETDPPLVSIDEATPLATERDSQREAADVATEKSEEVTLKEAMPKETPLKETPLKETTLKETPLKESPLKETTPKETPLKETTPKETPPKETTPKETALKETPLKESPQKETPSKESPLKETPLKETPLNETTESPVEPPTSTNKSIPAINQTATASAQVSSPPKEPITLPLKKQLEKLKQFKEQDESAVDSERSVLPGIPLQNVDVKTSTLVDILNAVQSNLNSQALTEPEPSEAAQPTALPARGTHVENLHICEDSTTSTSSMERYNSPADKTLVSKLKRKERRSESPRSSDTGSSRGSRRSERRSGRFGRDPAAASKAHKTLEETFAEIAAETSKFTLDMASSSKDPAENADENDAKMYEVTVKEFTPGEGDVLPPPQKDEHGGEATESIESQMVGSENTQQSKEEPMPKEQPQREDEAAIPDVRREGKRGELTDGHSEPGKDERIESVNFERVEPVKGERVEPVKEERPEPVTGERSEPIKGERVEPVKEDRVEPVKVDQIEPVKEERLEVRQPPKKRLSRLQSLYEDSANIPTPVEGQKPPDSSATAVPDGKASEAGGNAGDTAQKELKQSDSPLASHNPNPDAGPNKRKHASARKGRQSPSPKKTKTKTKSSTKESKRSSKSSSERKSRKSKHDKEGGEEPAPDDAAAGREKRKQQLREAFEAALRGEEVVSETLMREIASMNCLDEEKGDAGTRKLFDDRLFANAAGEVPQHTLSDIEKFINDGENLLKVRPAAFKEGEGGPVVEGGEAAAAAAENGGEFVGEPTEDEDEIMELTEMTGYGGSYIATEDPHMNYETPADTPIATPSASPPPTYDNVYDELTGVRRSHRIKLITKKQVGRGLVRDREAKSTMDDHLTDLAQVEAINAKFLKDMEERLCNFQVVKENEYICEPVVSREARKMICDCFLTAEEEERGELGCGEDCLNRMLMIECGPNCNVKERCTNKRFQMLLCSPCRVFRTEKKGFGILAEAEIWPGEFIMEYVGEVIDGDEFERRREKYSREKNRHYYFMALRSDTIIDATSKGNISRFINHSCDPNAETQKWTVNGELRIGFFSRKTIMPGEEITFNYQYQRYGREAQRCYCESANCRGWIGEEPNSDEGEQIDDDDSDDEKVSRDGSDSGDEVDESSEGTDNEAEEVNRVGTEAEAKPDAAAKSAKVKRRPKKAGDPDSAPKKAGKQPKASARVRKTPKKPTAAKARKPKPKSISLEDPDIEDEVLFLRDCGMKNQGDTLRFSRLMVRAKLQNTRLNLIQVLHEAEPACRQLFLDYHGLRLLHGWMSEDGHDLQMRLRYLETLQLLPVTDKTILMDSKVYQAVESWCGAADPPPENAAGDEKAADDKASESDKQPEDAPPIALAAPEAEPPEETLRQSIEKLAGELMAVWRNLKEIFRIPKRERIEQMKEHEREADRQYAEQVEHNDEEDADPRSRPADRYERDRFGRGGARFSKPSSIGVLGGVSSFEASAQRRMEAACLDESIRHLSKDERRKMFAAKVAQDENEKRLAEDRCEFDMKCRFFGLDPKTTKPQEMPFCVNPDTGEWYSVQRKPIAPPPNYAHSGAKALSTNPEDYFLPAAVYKLPPQWRYAISEQGHLYYYHLVDRIPQWEPPTPEQFNGIAASEDSDSDYDPNVQLDGSTDEEPDNEEELVKMDDAALRAYIDQKVKARRLKRQKQLVDSRPISPRREEDRIYNQNEVRKYKENKEKIRKRKEEIRRRKADALVSGNFAALTKPLATDSPSATADLEDSDGSVMVGALPIQDYLLSSDEEDRLKEECNNSPLIGVIVRGDKIVDELDALTTKRRLRRPLPPHGDLFSLTEGDQLTLGGDGGESRDSDTAAGSCTTSAALDQLKRRSKQDRREKKKSKESESSKTRRLKEKFRCELAGVVTQNLVPFRMDTCKVGRICSDEDFNHLAKKLTHFVMIKELRYCEAIGQKLEFTESVRNKTREFIKKYMVKYGEVYVKPSNDPDFKDIPFKL